MTHFSIITVQYYCIILIRTISGLKLVLATTNDVGVIFKPGVHWSKAGTRLVS